MAKNDAIVWSEVSEMGALGGYFEYYGKLGQRLTPGRKVENGETEYSLVRSRDIDMWLVMVRSPGGAHACRVGTAHLTL